MGEVVQKSHDKLGTVALQILAGYVAIMLVGYVVGSFF